MDRENILDVIMEVDIRAINGVLESLAAERASDPVSVRAIEIAALAVVFAYSEAVHSRFELFLRESSGVLTDEQRKHLKSLGPKRGGSGK